MLDFTCLEVGIALGNSPHLFQTNAVVLEACAIFVKFEVLLDSLSEGAPAALREYGLLGFDLDARLVGVFLGSVLSDAKISGDHSADTSVLIVNDLVASNAWKDIYSHPFSLFTQPFAKVSQTDDIVAMVVHTLWQEHGWNVKVVSIFK